MTAHPLAASETIDIRLSPDKVHLTGFMRTGVSICSSLVTLGFNGFTGSEWWVLNWKTGDIMLVRRKQFQVTGADTSYE